jgi:hypothetical protein
MRPVIDGRLESQAISRAAGGVADRRAPKSEALVSATATWFRRVLASLSRATNCVAIGTSPKRAPYDRNYLDWWIAEPPT